MPGEALDALTKDIAIGRPEDALNRLDAAFKAVSAAAPIERRIATARRDGLLDEEAIENSVDADIGEAYRESVIGGDEAVTVVNARRLAREVIEVDDFDTGSLFQTMQDAQRRMGESSS